MCSHHARGAALAIAMAAAALGSSALALAAPSVCNDDVACGPGAACVDGACEDLSSCERAGSCARLQLLLAAGYTHGFVGGDVGDAHVNGAGAEVGVSGTWTGALPRGSGFVHGPAAELALGVHGAAYADPLASSPLDEETGYLYEEAQLLVRPTLRLGWEIDRLGEEGLDGARSGLGVRVLYAIGTEHRVARFADGTFVAHGPAVAFLLPMVDARADSWVRPFVRLSLLHVPVTVDAEHCGAFDGVAPCEDDVDADTLYLSANLGVGFP